MAYRESYAGKINRKLNKKLHVVEVASGRQKADLVLKNATYVNVFCNELSHGDIAVAEGLIAGMGEHYEGAVEVDMGGKLVLPGFVDAHIHLESALVSPKEFANAVIPHGTTTVITDPHEIANVMGTDGIEYMLQATEDLPVDVRFMLPSCVPATPLDESGAVLDYRAIDSFYEHNRVEGLAEMMNYELAGLYVGYQTMHILFPPNTYETAMLATVSDTVDAEGVLLFNESYVAGGGTLGYLAADGERVSAGTAVAEVYSDASQAALRQQLTQLGDQIDLLQKSQNASATQLDTMRKERSSALYDLMDALDSGEYDETEKGTEEYLLAQNKLWVITGEVTDFSGQIAALVDQEASVQAQLGTPTQITAPQTGYFIRSASSGRLNAGAGDILALNATDLKAYIESEPETALDGCVGKIVSGFSWQYAGVCSAKEGQKLLGQDGKPLKKSVQIRFPGQVETPLKASVTDVSIDEESGLTRFVITCEVINGDVLRLNKANAQIIVGESTGLLVPAAAVHYLKEDGSEAETQGENYIPGVYVKYGNLARFCKIDPVDDAHPLVTEGDHILVLPSGTANSVSQVRLYDEIIVSGQNLYDGKLL